MQVTTLDDGVTDREILDESNTPHEGERDARESEHGEGGGSEGQNDGSKEEKEAEESSGERP